MHRLETSTFTHLTPRARTILDFIREALDDLAEELAEDDRDVYIEIKISTRSCGAR
ncbi:hypothetical protein [Alicyclobacillus vulcanalis]|uniref:Uncharacterized protein n=1 Tax=Alicyclobacillus vulcanalis TaxID=252246 RepID=A0A1N7MS90_9BACL|nr:hypothetical protein [Alicyclobacillus vulcanalis]SIS89004.1 hypothetical protein SAMN05421799_10673 [Alicyclobacillus vulcanalis]